MHDRPVFTAKDAHKLAGLSYRQLNDWDSRLTVPSDRPQKGGWRKFTPKQMFALMICHEIRRLYGTPVERLRFVKNFMMQQEANHLSAAVRLMQYGLQVFLFTDLKEMFVMDSDLEFADYMKLGYFRVEEPRPYMFLRLNEVVTRLLGAMKEPVQLVPRADVYRRKAEVDAMITVRTAPEFEVLQALRSGMSSRVEVTLKDGQVRHLNVEGNAEAENITATDDAVSIKRTNAFETISLTTRDGQIVKTTREVPRQYSKEDNEPVLFAFRVSSQPEPATRNRDGERPSDFATTQTNTRRDRKPLSHENHAPQRARVPDAQPRKVSPDSRR